MRRGASEEDRATAFEALDAEYVAKQTEAQVEVAFSLEDAHLAAEATLRRRHMGEVIETMRMLEQTHKRLGAEGEAFDHAAHEREVEELRKLADAEKEAELAKIEKEREIQERRLQEAHAAKLKQIEVEEAAERARQAEKETKQLKEAEDERLRQVAAAEAKAKTEAEKASLLEKAQASYETAHKEIKARRADKSKALEGRLAARRKRRAAELERDVVQQNREAARLKKQAAQQHAQAVELKAAAAAVKRGRGDVPEVIRGRWHKALHGAGASKGLGGLMKAAAAAARAAPVDDVGALRAKVQAVGGGDVSELKLKLDRIEDLVNRLSIAKAGNSAPSTSASPTRDYQDAGDPRPGDRLVSVQKADLSPGKLARFEFAERLVSMLGVDLDLRIAEGLPESALRGNAFRNSYRRRVEILTLLAPSRGQQSDAAKIIEDVSSSTVRARAGTRTTLLRKRSTST